MNKSLAKLLKPSPRSLFKTIKELCEFAHKVRSIRINKTNWLTHVNFFLKVTIEKNIINMKLANFLIHTSSNGKNNLDGSWFYNWTKCLIEIKVNNLMKSFGNYLGFVFFNGAIKIFFNFDNPFAANGFVIRRKWNKVSIIVA